MLDMCDSRIPARLLPSPAMNRRPYPRRAWLTASPIALSLALVACATQAPPPPTVPATQSRAATAEPAPATPGQAAAAPVATTPPPPQHPAPDVRAAFVREATEKYGLDAAYVDGLLSRAQLRESTVVAMARPAEAKPWRDYRPIFITPQRIEGGRAFLAEHRAALERVEAQYGVPKEVIVAILGVETHWGRNTGKTPVLDALYTLAFNYPRTNLPDKIERENRREAFFRDELMQLLALGKETGLDVASLQGSYAGAMGWGQFMPSSYRLYAVDGDADGRRDLFNDLDDVFASVANYFVQKGGWVRGQPVMVRAAYVSPTGAQPASAQPTGAQASSAPSTTVPTAGTIPREGEPVHTLAALAQAGYTPLEPVSPELTAAPILLEGENGDEHWLTFRNFRAIWSYNNSIRYATAVYQLAQLIGAPAEAPVVPPAEDA